MKRIFIIFLFCFSSVFAQNIYQPHEVERPVEPTGGTGIFNQFLVANLQMPFKSIVRGTSGRVHVKGIVETDGTMTDLQVSRGLDPLCDQEALRILGLYKAWQPALKNGEKVRQYLTFPIMFKATPPVNFDSTTYSVTDYFDKKFYATSDPEKAEYRVVRYLDDRGFLKSDVVSEQKKGKKWSEMVTVPFARKEVWFKHAYNANKIDSVRAYEISARDENLTSYVSEATFLPGGQLLSETQYDSNNKKSKSREFDLNGLLRKLRIYSDSSSTEIVWYDNGQVKSVVEYPAESNLAGKELVYINSWDRDGTQTVKDGNGSWRGEGGELYGGSYIEEGNVVDGHKDGGWIGKWSDGKILYKEIYAAGALLEGTSYEGSEEVRYTKAVIQPKFKGGVNNFYKFLGQNIMYPLEASRRGIQGRVFLSFVVCEDGSLCDYKVEKGVGFGLDDEALRVVKKMNHLWEPGEMRGKKVRVKYNLPINFTVQR
jgi:TonB family protein